MIALRPCLYILDVGHGNCAVLMSGKADVIVIDVGRCNTLLEFLDQQEIKRIRTIYLSHADQDHIGSLVGLLASNTVTVEKVVVNSDSSKATKVWDDLVYVLDNEHRAGALKFCVGMLEGHGEVLNEVEIRVLGPSRYLASKGAGSRDQSGRRITSNSISAVLRISVSGRHVAILPADIDRVGLDDLLKHDANLKASIVVYPHHGGVSGASEVRPFAEKLLGATSPSIVVFSIGRGRYGTPNPETISVLREILPKVRIICTQLSEHCSKKLPPEPLAHLSNVFALGRSDRTCCGGTIVVPLDQVSDMEPKQAAHTGFILSNAETPLCLRDLKPLPLTSRKL